MASAMAPACTAGSWILGLTLAWGRPSMYSSVACCVAHYHIGWQVRLIRFRQHGRADPFYWPQGSAAERCGPVQASDAPAILAISCPFASGAGLASEAIKGINILKSGSDPEVKPDEQYPQWVWQVGSPGKMLSQLNREQDDPEQETIMEDVSAITGPGSTIGRWLHVQLRLAKA